MPPVSPRPAGWAGVVVALLVVLTACSGGYAPTELPPRSEPSATAEDTPPARPSCDDATQSYEPEGPLPAPDELPDGSPMARIAERGRLIAGVSADTYLLGARDPSTGAITGFDIDMARSIAEAITGDPDAIELKVISAADRVPALESARVDIVVRAMTMTCDRWDDVAFSAVYYQAGQKVLARSDSGIESVLDLAGHPVCAPAGTSSVGNLQRRVPRAQLVTAPDHTGCLRLFQLGQVDAITGDDTVLAGLAAQDPYAEVVPGEALSTEPYGIAVNRDDVDLARFINARLAQIKGNGQWQRSYDRWLRPALGEATPPKAEYGR